MKILRLFIFFITIIFCDTAFADLRGLPQITILSASSITAPMTEIIRQYSRQANITVAASYDDSAEQARKISEGNSADIYISSHTKWMKELKQKGVIDVYSITNLVRNRLVLVTAASDRYKNNFLNKADLSTQIIDLNNRTSLVMANPDDTALGAYSKQAIEQLGVVKNVDLWEKIHNNIIRANSAKNALYLIEYGDNAGILYYNDAFNNEHLNIIGVFDEVLHDPIVYQAAVVAGENMSYARDFMEFLKRPENKEIFRKYGFMVD